MSYRRFAIAVTVIQCVSSCQLAAQVAGPTWRHLSNLANASRNGTSVEWDLQTRFEDYRHVAIQGGNADRGKLVFEKQCATCHEIDGLGQPIGPSLTSMASRGLDHVLWNILDPSRDMDSQFLEYHVITTDGTVRCGMIVAETATAVTLVDLEGARTTIPRAAIEKLQSTGKSFMPDRFDKLINPDAMADLLAFLQQAGAVEFDSRAER